MFNNVPGDCLTAPLAVHAQNIFICSLDSRLYAIHVLLYALLKGFRFFFWTSNESLKFTRPCAIG